MSDQSLIDRLDALPTDSDLADQNTYAKLLGYDQPDPTPQAAGAPQAETAAPVEQEVPAQEAQAQPATTSEAASSAPAGAAETEDAENVAGVATKDGKRIIPFTVLHDTRAARAAAEQQARQLAEANQRLQAELEAIRNGQSTAASQAQAQAAADLISDAELQEIEADIPVVGKLAKAYRALSEQLAQVTQSVQAPQIAAAQATEAARVQALIDQRPLLAQWQARGGLAWEAAVAMDNRLRSDPAWAAKSEADRFVEVERQIASEFGIQVPDATHPQPAAAKPATKQPAAPAAPVAAALPTLTDLSGRPALATDPFKGMTSRQMQDKANDMSVEDLRRLAGLSY